MIFEYLRLNINVTDDEFDTIYPVKVRELAQRHWTPVPVAKQVAEFLVERPGTHVLDIGSGVGKFCMIGATYTKGNFTGVEQRHDLVDLSNKLAKRYDIQNVEFIHSNIMSTKFRDFDAFYFYNSFQENIAYGGKIDDKVIGNERLYYLYSNYVLDQFASLPFGTRIVTYWGSMNIIPSSYQLEYSSNSGLLKFWKKIN